MITHILMLVHISPRTNLFLLLLFLLLLGYLCRDWAALDNSPKIPRSSGHFQSSAWLMLHNVLCRKCVVLHDLIWIL